MKIDELVAYQLSALNIAIKQLNDCLERNGSLSPGQFPDAIRATIERAGSQRERPDYVLLSDLLRLLDDDSHPLN